MPLSAAHDYPLWLNAAIFLVSAVVVWIGGTRLSNYVDGISALTGMGQALAGMLLLGCITSLHELANTITASSIGNPALGASNLLAALPSTASRTGGGVSAIVPPGTVTQANARVVRKVLRQRTRMPGALVLATRLRCLRSRTADTVRGDALQRARTLSRALMCSRYS